MEVQVIRSNLHPLEATLNIATLPSLLKKAFESHPWADIKEATKSLAQEEGEFALLTEHAALLQWARKDKRFEVDANTMTHLEEYLNYKTDRPQTNCVFGVQKIVLRVMLTNVDLHEKDGMLQVLPLVYYRW